MAPLLVTLNDLEGHFPVAGLFKCNLSNILQYFTRFQPTARSRGSSATAGLLVFRLCGTILTRLICAGQLNMNGWRMMRGDSGVHISLKGSGALSEKIIPMMATGLSIFSQSVSWFIRLHRMHSTDVGYCCTCFDIAWSLCVWSHLITIVSPVKYFELIELRFAGQTYVSSITQGTVL